MAFRPGPGAEFPAFCRAVTAAGTVTALGFLANTLLRGDFRPTVSGVLELVAVLLMFWPVAVLFAAFLSFVPFVMAVSIAVRMPRFHAIWFMAWGAVAPQLVLWRIAGAPEKLPSWQMLLFYALPGALGGLAAWSRLRR